MKALDKKTIELVKNLSKAMDELTRHWDGLSEDECELLSDEYPLTWMSFDEMSAEANNWLGNLQDKN